MMRRPMVKGFDSDVVRDSNDAPRRQIAVALAHDLASGEDAPRVVASGKGEEAKRILDLAFAAGVKVREDADLAEILSAVDIDQPIPLEAFAAVAEILAYVYRMNGMVALDQDPAS